MGWWQGHPHGPVLCRHSWVLRLCVLVFLTPGAWHSESQPPPPPQILCAPGLSPQHTPRRRAGHKVLCVSPQDHPIPRPLRQEPTRHRPLPKEPTFLAEALLTAAHLGPWRGGPGRGRPLSYCLQTPAAQIGIPDTERGPCSPLEPGQTPGFFPGRVHLGTPITSSCPPHTRHLASHQLVVGPKQTERRQAGGSTTIPSAPRALPGSALNPEV